MPSEKYAARRGSVEDGMRMITACFARATQRCTSRTYMHFLHMFQEVRANCKTRNQLARRGPHVRIDPSVAGDYRYVVACLGWRLPQRPPWSIPRLVMMRAKDGEVAHAFQPLLQVSRLFFWRLMQAQWPIP